MTCIRGGVHDKYVHAKVESGAKGSIGTRSWTLVEFAEDTLRAVRILFKEDTVYINSLYSTKRFLGVIDIVMCKAFVPKLQRLWLGVTP